MTVSDTKVTILICTYHPVWEKLKGTICSVLKQVYDSYEIVIADDGSQNDCFQELERMFQKAAFTRYQFRKLKKNQGTVRNLMNGLVVSKGMFVKPISPGDLLFSENTLKDWIDDVERKHADISFGRAVYYKKDKCGLTFEKSISYPINTTIYTQSDSEKKYQDLLLNYIALRDTPVGAAFIVKRELLDEYMRKLPKTVLYAEDNAYRMMIACGIEFHFYNKNVIFYECGTGISNATKDSPWNEVIEKEIMQTKKAMSKVLRPSYFTKRFSQYLSAAENKEYYKYFLLPEIYKWKFRKMIHHSYTDTNVSKEDFLHMYCE